MKKKYLDYGKLRREAYLEGRSCVECGSVERLEFHHVDPKTKCHGDFWLWRKELREAEIAKCIILCRVCHRKITNEQRRSGLFPARGFHGSPEGIRSGCRCDKCLRCIQKADFIRIQLVQESRCKRI